MRQAESGAADLVALAGELRPLFAGNAEQAERDRRLPDENVRAPAARNLFKVMVPRRMERVRRPAPNRLGYLR